MRTLAIAAALVIFVVPGLCEERKFTVGVTAPFTGAWAEYGAAVQNGITLAQEDDPALNERIKFLIEDDRYDPKLAIAAFNKFTSLDRVDLLYVFGNEPVLAIAPIAEQRKIPAVVVSQHPKAGQGYRYIIRFMNPVADFQRAISGYFRKNRIKNVALLKSDISFNNLFADELSRQFSAPGETLTVVQSFLPAELDFRSTILKLRAAQFDILGLYLTSPQLIEFLKQARDLKFHPAFFGTTPFESRTLLEKSAELANGVVYSHMTVADSFRARYVTRFGSDIQVTYAGQAYDFANLVNKVFGRSTSRLSPDEIIAALQERGAGEGALGVRRFVASAGTGNYFEFPIAVKRVGPQGWRVVVD